MLLSKVVDRGVVTLVESKIIQRGDSRLLKIEDPNERVSEIVKKHSDIISDVLNIQKDNKPLVDIDIVDQLIKGGL